MTPTIKRATLLLAALSAASVVSAYRPHAAVAVPAVSPAEILQELRTFRMTATVLHVGAHPDDENTQMITALSRGRAVRTAYLSVTRGDGGQNLLGPEFGYKLGIARTQELLAARSIDGGRQFFTRALDFGFSKDYLETFGVWNKDSILSDVVRVIRTFRPDVIVTVFSTVPGGTHGHHTASAVLALDAFKIAADPKAFPEQLKTLKPWQPKRIFSGGRGGGGTTGARMDIGGNDPVSSESFSALSQRSRAMHKTQGFGQPGGGGGPGRAGAPGGGAGAGGAAAGGAGAGGAGAGGAGAGGAGAGGAGAGGAGAGGAGAGRAAGGGAGRGQVQSFNLLAGDSAAADIFEGIDTTWGRFPGGAAIERLTGEATAKFDVTDPSKSVPALLEIRKLVAAVPADPLVSEKQWLLDRIILECAGVTIQTLIPKAEVVPGEVMRMTHIVTETSNIPVRWLGTQYPRRDRMLPAPVLIAQNRPDTIQATDTLPASTPVTQPYWLKSEGTPGMFHVDDPSLIGLPENPAVYQIGQRLEIGGQRFWVPDQPLAITPDSARGQTLRHLAVIPPASVAFASDVRLFGSGAIRDIKVDVSANRPSSGTLELEVPKGWTATPSSQRVALGKAGDRSTFTFKVTAPKTASTVSIGAHLVIGGKTWNTAKDSINYPHIPLQLLQPVARLKAVAADVAVAGKTVAYIPGAGDDVPEALEQLGYTVTQIPAKSVTADALKSFDAVVIGVRASNVNADLGAAMPALTAYAEGGGTVIEQYNQTASLRNNVLGPYPLTIGGDRVTNENATVTFLAPNHPALNTPNKITSADFEGWVQERGIYFPNQWDPRYTPLLAMSDAGEAPLNGSLLVASVGKGYFVYTGLVFFRELPAGVPGAYRLFANLVSLGKKPSVVPFP